MEIGFIYQRKDPRQAEAIDYLRRYVRDRGILARIVETDRQVTTPTVIINGKTLKDLRLSPRSSGKKQRQVYPSPTVIANALDAFIWSV